MENYFLIRVGLPMRNSENFCFMDLHKRPEVEVLRIQIYCIWMQQMTEKINGGFSIPNFSSKYQFDILGGFIFTLVALVWPFSSY